MSAKKPAAVSFNKAKMYFNYTFCLFIFLAILNQLLDKIENNALVQAIIVAFNIFVLVIFVLLGTYYIAKSYLVKEPFHAYKIFYLAGYILSIIVLFILSRESYYKIYYILN